MKRTRQLFAAATQYLDRGIGPDNPQRGHAVARLAFLLIGDPAADPGAVPVERVLRLAEEILPSPGLDPEEAAVLHFLAAVAYGVRARRDGTRDGDERAMAHLNRATRWPPTTRPTRRRCGRREIPLPPGAGSMRWRSCATGPAKP
jgi:hypothetical protein